MPYQALGAPPPDLQPTPPVYPGPPPKTSAMTWVLRGLGLVLVAAVSGMIWWSLQSGSGGGDSPKTSTSKKPGQFEYSTVAERVIDSDCAANATGKVRQHFQDHPCKQVYRALFSTTSDKDGKKILVSVIAVRMPDATAANELRALVDGEDTGNVKDLTRDDKVKVEGGPQWVAYGEYKSKVNKDLVVIVESDFYGAARDDARDSDTLSRVSTDALRLGDQIAE
ncbi:hypothetical protein [Goodfellowiella coeruleoviolacea]|nr:hypothetical protein [Goodfellowiella coeruleoviolacea]